MDSAREHFVADCVSLLGMPVNNWVAPLDLGAHVGATAGTALGHALGSLARGSFDAVSFVQFCARRSHASLALPGRLHPYQGELWEWDGEDPQRVGVPDASSHRK
jgi:hypothetical protein